MGYNHVGRCRSRAMIISRSRSTKLSTRIRSYCSISRCSAGRSMTRLTSGPTISILSGLCSPNPVIQVPRRIHHYRIEGAGEAAPEGPVVAEEAGPGCRRAASGKNICDSVRSDIDVQHDLHVECGGGPVYQRYVTSVYIVLVVTAYK